MNDNIIVISTIFGMAVVTYLTRFAGFFISHRIKNMPKSIEQGLQYIPGTIIISIIAPQIFSGGSITLTASLICIGAALVFRNLVAVMLTGVLYVALLRNFIFI